MQVTVETNEGLERKLRVQIPEDRVRGEVDKRLGDLARSVRMPGFRPGKTPVKVVRQRFGQKVRDEVVGEMVQSTFFDAIAQENLRPAGSPTIEPVDSNAGAGVTYTAVFDVYPEITLPPFETLRIERPRASVAADDVERMLATLQRQRREWQAVDRPGTTEDRAVVDFTGYVDGEPLEQATASEVPVELGASRMIDGFESGLVGVKAGDERTLDLQFPDQYGNEALAGKPVRFEVEVHRVEEPRLPEVDDDFAAAFGVSEGGIEAFRREVGANMERELADAVRNVTKQRVMDALLGGGHLALPRSLVEQERGRAFEQRRTELRHAGVDVDSIDLDPAMFEEQAVRRVSLGLLLAEIIKTNDIQVDPERVRERVETIASTYEQPAQVIQWYYSDRERLSEVESTVLEDQVVEWLLERVEVVDVDTSFDEVLNPGQTTGSAPA